MRQKARILVVDDDATIGTAIKEVLLREGLEADIACSGEEAIRKSNDRFYNLALVDIRLPDMDGTKLLTEMKKTVPKMRKIIITGYPDMQNVIASIKAAADDYIIKPAKPSELVSAVIQQLQQQFEENEYTELLEEKFREFIESRMKELTTVQ